MLVELVAVAAAGVGLPDLDQLARHRPAEFVEHPPGHDDALPDRLARVPGRQVGIERVDVLVAEARRPAFESPRDRRSSAAVFRMAQGAAAVRRVIQPRLHFPPDAATRALVSAATAAISAVISRLGDATRCGAALTKRDGTPCPLHLG